MGALEAQGETSKHANTKLLKKDEVPLGLYVDFEGRKDEDPVLLGVLYRELGSRSKAWTLRQFVFDSKCAVVDEQAGRTSGQSVPSDVLKWLLGISAGRVKPFGAGTCS